MSGSLVKLLEKAKKPCGKLHRFGAKEKRSSAAIKLFGLGQPNDNAEATGERGEGESD
jgi:hypothetical protein